MLLSNVHDVLSYSNAFLTMTAFSPLSPAVHSQVGTNLPSGLYRMYVRWLHAQMQGQHKMDNLLIMSKLLIGLNYIILWQTR